MARMSLDTKLEVYLRRAKYSESIRLFAGKIDLPKSTLHYNLPKIEDEIKKRQTEKTLNPLRRLLDRILTYVMVGKMSSRGTSKVLAELDSTDIWDGQVVGLFRTLVLSNN